MVIWGVVYYCYTHIRYLKTMIIAGPEHILEHGVVNHHVQRDRGRGQVADIRVVEETTGLGQRDW